MNDARCTTHLLHVTGVVAAAADPTTTVVVTCPRSNQFRCASGESCIPKWQVCDSIADCSDGSDELECGTTQLIVRRLLTLYPFVRINENPLEA